MKMPSLLLAATLLSLAACSVQPTPKTEKETAEAPDTTKVYLPVADLLREDLRKVDSFSAAILLKTTIGAKKDSSYIDLESFKKLSREFFPEELETAPFLKNYTESSIVDQTSQVTNFIYTANDNKLPVQKVILYIPPSLGTDKISRVYMEKSFQKGDTVIQQKLTWKLKGYLMIIEDRLNPDGKSLLSVKKAIWNPDLFNEE